MISGMFIEKGEFGANIPLKNKEEIYKYCQELGYNTSLPLFCDFSSELGYILSFISKSDKDSKYFILLNLDEDLFKLFKNKEITLDEIVYIIEESGKLDNYELFLCCLYYSHNYTNLENFEYALKSFLCKIEDDEDYIDLYLSIYGDMIKATPLFSRYIDFEKFFFEQYTTIRFNDTNYIFLYDKI